MYRKILVAYNGTSESRSALYECVRLAPGPSAEIHLLVVVIPPSPALAGEVPFVIDREEDLIAAKRQMENELLVGHRILSDAGLQVVNHLEVGDPIDVIGKLANRSRKHYRLEWNQLDLADPDHPRSFVRRDDLEEL